jgi:F-type H+-transporting ATPase subunit alpha
VASIWAGTTGKMDSIAVPDIRRFETEFLDLLLVSASKSLM